MTTRIVTIVFFLFISSVQLFSQTDSLRIKFAEVVPEIEKSILSQMKHATVQGVSVGLFDSSGIVWSKGFGYKDVAGKLAPDNTTLYCVGSVSKLFTGISIMQLHEQGIIDINKPIKNYIPEFAPLGAEDFIDQITIASVLTHHSGLPSDDWKMLFSNSATDYKNAVSFFNSQYVCTKPNTIHSYSNIGYTLLGVLIERVTGEDFSFYVKEHILKPLGMKNSSFTMDDTVKTILSKQYLSNKKEFSEPQVGVLPAGGLYSNIEDMSCFAQMLLNKGTFHGVQILKEETFRKMISVQNADVRRDYDLQVGLTWFLTQDGTWYKAGGSFSHGGDTHTFHTSFTVLPYQNLASLVCTNSENGGRIAMNIDRTILEKALDVKGIDTCFPKQIISKPKLKAYFPKSEFKELEGDYSFSINTLHAKAKSNSIVLKMKLVAFVLKPLPDSTFAVKIRFLGISFKNKQLNKMWFDVVDNDTIIVVNSWDRDFYFSKKIDPINKSFLEAWKGKSGIYQRVDTEKKELNNLSLDYEDNQLIIKSNLFNQKIHLTINPIDNENAIINGLGRNTGDRIRSFEENGQMVLFVSGLKYIRFSDK